MPCMWPRDHWLLWCTLILLQLTSYEEGPRAIVIANDQKMSLDAFLAFAMCFDLAIVIVQQLLIPVCIKPCITMCVLQSQLWGSNLDSQCVLKEHASAWLIEACFAAYARMPSAMSGLTSSSLSPFSIHHMAFHSRKARTRHISSLTSWTSSFYRSAWAFDFTHSHWRPI